MAKALNDMEPMKVLGVMTEQGYSWLREKNSSMILFQGDVKFTRRNICIRWFEMRQ